MSLTSRARVLTVLNHETPDRVPIVIGASNATSISNPTYHKLKQLLGVEAPEQYLYDWPELGAAKIDEVVLERLHSDVRGVLDREPAYVREKNLNREPGSAYFNSWAWVQWKVIRACGSRQFIRWLSLIRLKILNPIHGQI